MQAAPEAYCSTVVTAGSLTMAYFGAAATVRRPLAKSQVRHCSGSVTAAGVREQNVYNLVVQIDFRFPSEWRWRHAESTCTAASLSVGHKMAALTMMDENPRLFSDSTKEERTYNESQTRSPTVARSNSRGCGTRGRRPRLVIWKTGFDSAFQAVLTFRLTWRQRMIREIDKGKAATVRIWAPLVEKRQVYELIKIHTGQTLHYPTRS